MVKNKNVLQIRAIFDGVPILDEKINPSKDDINVCFGKIKKKIQ